MFHALQTCTIFFLVSYLAGCAAPLAQPETKAETEAAKHTKVVDYAMRLIGTPYRYGGKVPEAGLDCSGFVSHVYKQAGMSLDGNAADIASQGKVIERADLRAGDLVFFNTRQRRLSHVGIYIGDGRFLHAPGTGERIRVSSIHNPYFARHFDAARTYPHLNTDDH